MISVRRLAPAEWVQAFPVMAQLRSLDRETFLSRVRMQSHCGYELAGAFRNDRLIAVMGMRPVHTLARGSYLHIDDLVVDSSERGSGAGRALLTFAETEARAREMTSVFLDARKDAVGFYERADFQFHQSPSMKKVF